MSCVSSRLNYAYAPYAALNGWTDRCPHSHAKTRRSARAVTRWIDDATAPLRQRHGGVAVIVDPDRLAGTTVDLSAYGVVRSAGDLWQLRCHDEIEGRHRPADADRLVLRRDAIRRSGRVTSCHGISPSGAVQCSSPRYPPMRSRSSTRSRVSSPLSPYAKRQGRQRSGRRRSLRHGWGVAIPETAAGNELAAAVRLVTGTAPRALLTAAAAAARSPLARAVLADPSDRTLLDTAWSDWLDPGPASRDDVALRGCGPVFLALLHQGLVHPAPQRATMLPGWVAAGVVPRVRRTESARCSIPGRARTRRH